jgi:integrase
MVRDLRQDGKSEATIHAVLGAAGRIFKFAARRLGLSGVIPTSLMLPSERPKVSLAKRLPIFTPEQVEQTLAASSDPYRTLFTVAALTGARISELCGLTWADVTVDNLDEAEITFGFQVDRHGNRRPTKTDGSARTVPIPRELADDSRVRRRPSHRARRRRIDIAKPSDKAPSLGSGAGALPISGGFQMASIAPTPTSELAVCDRRNQPISS